MSKVTIYHNPRCTKSRQTLQLLEEKGIDADVVLYLKEPPSRNRIRQILKMLGMQPRELMRKGEKVFKELKLADPDHKVAELIDAMAENPILIERPIVVCGDRAAIGRPPENVLEILE